MKEIYKEIIKLSHDEGVSVLATVVRQGGPAPRGVGAKCLLRSDGTMAGSVGGGMLEAKTLDAAREVMKTGRPRRLGFSLKGTDVAETDMLCGGDVEVFLEPVVPSHAVHRALARELERIERRGGMGLLCTVLDTDQWEGGRVPRLFLGSDGRRAGDLDQSGGLERALQERFSPLSTLRRPGIFSLEQDSGTVEVYLEPVSAEPVLYVFGGGHVSRQVVPLAALVGFPVVVVDDREEFADAGQFPEAREVRCMPFGGVMARLPVDVHAFVVIVTRGHLYDKEVLGQALRTEARYIGMIGSRRKRDLIYKRLLEEGFTEEDLARVHSPIGLDIGAETPEEIAVSIVAELIDVRAGGRRP
ncbi:MAG: XdhC family protein [Deltaproteobacteria bacterium]|nr:XdhC family protein [Deltaproteobacteria bacterium]